MSSDAENGTDALAIKRRKPLSPEHRAKISAANRGRLHSEEEKEKMRKPKGRKHIKTPEHVAKITAAITGKPKSDAHREKLRAPKSDAHKSAISESAMNPETHAKRRKTMLGRYGIEHSKEDPHRNQNCVEYWVDRGHSEESARGLISAAQKARAAMRKSPPISHWSTKYWESQGLSAEDARARVSEIQIANSMKSDKAVSNAGTKFLDEVERLLGVPIEREVTLCERFKVDGFVREKNAVIEYFGSFWHMHPDQFSANDINRATGWRAASKWAEDAGRVRRLEMSGYRVFVVWDVDATIDVVNMIVSEISNAR